MVCVCVCVCVCVGGGGGVKSVGVLTSKLGCLENPQSFRSLSWHGVRNRKWIQKQKWMSLNRSKFSFLSKQLMNPIVLPVFNYHRRLKIESIRTNILDQLSSKNSKKLLNPVTFKTLTP